MGTNQKNKEWDSFYENKNAFGTSYQELEEFLNNIEPKGNFLDLGAGQGRDSILAHKKGFQVTAVDFSKVGIEQITALGIKGIVTDIFDFEFEKQYQVILLDAVIHCQQEDLEKEQQLFNKIERHLLNEGYLLLLTHQWDIREQYLLDLFQTHFPLLQLEFNKYIEHTFIPPQSEEESIMELSFMCFQKK